MPDNDKPKMVEIIVKFREGGILKVVDGVVKANHLKLENFYSIIAQTTNPKVKQVLTEDVTLSKRLLEMQQMAKEVLKKELDSLDLFVSISLTKETEVESTLAKLRDDPEIQYAYVSWEPAPPPDSTDYSPNQGYLRFGGVNASYAWRCKGGKGMGIKICDVEYGYSPHQDLQNIKDVYGDPNNSMDIVKNHGTNVLGILVAKHDGIGINGICPESIINFAAEDMFDTTGLDRRYAIQNAIGSLHKGDILLLEMQWKKPATTYPTYPAEIDPDVYSLIQACTHGGRIAVIEPAGTQLSQKAGQNLDLAQDLNGVKIWENRPNGSDSGAIMVGASDVHGDRCVESNYGSVVTCHALGVGIYTTGLCSSAQNQTTSFTDYCQGGFGGTSGASAIIAGAAACLQGRYRAKHRLDVIPPLKIRGLFQDDNLGSPQNVNSRSEPIGPMPDLLKIFKALGIQCSACPFPGW
jgi:hypothetical protein